MFKPQKLGPLVQKLKISQNEVSCIFSKIAHKPYLTQFSSFEGDIAIFGKLKMSSTIYMLIIFAFEDFILM